MSAPVFRFLLRRHAVSLLLVGLAPALIGAVVGIVFPSYSGLRDTLQAVARPFQKLFFGDQLDIFSVSGAFTLPFRHPLSILSMTLGGAIPALNSLSLERERGGLYLLMASPITRTRYILTMVAFQVPVALWFAGSTLLGAFVGASLAGVSHEVPWQAYGCLSAQTALLYGWFAMLSLLLCVLAEERNVAGRRLAILVFLFYLAAMAAEYWKSMTWLKWITPLGWFDVAKTVHQSAVPLSSFLLLSGSALGLAVLAIVFENRRRFV